MFRVRRRPETTSSTAKRGAVGSAHVWDERTRADRAEPLRPRPAPEGPGRATTLSTLELAGLVRAVVASTLDARLPECPPERRAALAQELGQRLLEAFEPGPTRTERVPVPPPITPPECAESAAPAAAAPNAPAPVAGREPRARLLDLALEDRLGQLGNPLAARTDLRDRLVALALSRLACAPPDPDASSEDLRSLDVLQRRVAKVEQALAEARAALAYVTGLEHVDPGLASIYRHVQGLPPDDPRRAQKGAALECIFRANLSLQKPGS